MRPAAQGRAPAALPPATPGGSPAMRSNEALGAADEAGCSARAARQREQGQSWGKAGGREDGDASGGVEWRRREDGCRERGECPVAADWRGGDGRDGNVQVRKLPGAPRRLTLFLTLFLHISYTFLMFAYACKAPRPYCCDQASGSVPPTPYTYLMRLPFCRPGGGWAAAQEGTRRAAAGATGRRRLRQPGRPVQRRAA